jgi:hypothetical protein
MSSKELLEANANLQTTNDFRRGSPSHFNIGRLHELIVGPAGNPTFNRTTPSLSFNYIVESISVGARFAPTTFRAFKFIVALLTSFSIFQLVVEFNVIPQSEGECNASIIFGDKAAPLKSDGEFIVVSSFPTNFSDTFTELIVTSLLNNDFQLVVKLKPTLNSEGARAPLSKLIVGCGYSEISFHFCEDCRIFREGVKDSTIGIVSNKSLIGLVGRIDHNGIFGRNLAFGRKLAYSHNELIELIMTFGRNELIELIMVFGRNELIEPNDIGPKLIVTFLIGCIGLVSPIELVKLGFVGCIDHNGVVGVIGLSLISLFDIVGFIGFGLVSFVRLIGISGISGLVGRISLVGQIGLDGIIGYYDLVGRIDQNGLVGRNDLVDYIGLDCIGHNGPAGFIGLDISFIGLSFVGFVGLGLASLGGHTSHINLAAGSIGFSVISGLVGQISLVSLGGSIGQISLIDLSVSSNHWPIGLIGVIGLGLIASSASTASLARRLISFAGLIGSSTHRLFCERLATAVSEATKITWRLKQAAALGVATLLQSSATETEPQLIISPPHRFTFVRS